VAIGETGLDFYRDHAPRADQERWFRAQLALADELGLPVVIHQRSALEETLAILEEIRPQAGGVLHCFDDGPAAVERAVRLGFLLGLGGCVTYGHAALEQAVRGAPAGSLVLETDSPYLEPEPRSLRRAAWGARSGRFWSAVEALPLEQHRAWRRALGAALAGNPHSRRERHALEDESPWRRELAARRLARLEEPASRLALRRALER